LNDDEVLDFAGGRISHEQLDAVHGHLDSCSVCQRLVSQAVRDPSASSADDEDEEVRWTPQFQSGDVVGRRYRVQRFVARGGMGEVYDAYDRDLQKRIALKTVLSTVVDGQRAVRRLKAEVQLAHRVSHPNVCRIYDIGTHELDGGRILHFLTMEFVDGERLTSRLQRGALPVADATHVVRQLLSGLSAAHAAGILHRDLKSDNIMLRPAPNEQVVAVILDFGLARTIEVDAHRMTTGASAFVGTPCYMAPEQLEAGELSPASDIYAFGVIWFEMLTGRLPFSARAPFERLRKAPPRPSSVAADVPASIDKIVLKCLERSPERRFRSPEEILVALDALEARGSSSGVSIIAPRRPPRALLPAVIGVLAMALLAFVRFHASAAAATAPPIRPKIELAPKENAVAGAAAHPTDRPSPPERAEIALPSSPPTLGTMPAAARRRPAAASPHRSASRADLPTPSLATSGDSAAAPSAGALSPATPPAASFGTMPTPPPSGTPRASAALPSARFDSPSPRVDATPSPSERPAQSPEVMGFVNPFHRTAR
jgi:serine/threonine protein kinase